jgi:hypothetical protein
LTGALVLGGCSLDSVVAAAGIPGTRYPAQIKNVKERGSYIDAFVDAGGFQYRLFFPANDTCRGLLTDPAGLSFTWLGLMGRVTRGEERCDAVGVLSLRAWRDRQPRKSREPLPRAPARYHQVYLDAEIIQLHGRFPLASQLGFSGSGRLIVVIPNDENCDGFGERGTASMEYRVTGPHPLTLLDKDKICPVLGLAQPPPQNLPPS